MPVAVLYPKVSLEMQTGRIARWLAGDGTAVTAGQVIFEIDNDKAAVEVEAPAGGVLHHLAAEGAEVEVGAEVARIARGVEADAAPSAPPMEPPAAVMLTPKGAGAPAARSRLPNPTPLARRIAREQGVSLVGLTGTGPGGRVQKSDVLARLAAIADRPAQAAVPDPAAAGPAAGGMLNAVWLRRGQGMPVVLLHGYSADLNNWRGLFAGARADFPVLALDLPAHGASPRAVPADADALCAQAEQTLAAQISGPVILGGHSFGGAVAARLAARGNIDVRGLCLFAPAGLGPHIDEPFTRGILRARRPASLRPWLERLVHDPAVITDALVQAVAAQRRDDGLTAAMSAFADRFFPDATQVVLIRSDLARLRMPARVVFGRQDRILPFAATRDLPATAGLHAVEACGHLPHLEHPGLSLRILSEVWRSAV